MTWTQQIFLHELIRLRKINNIVAGIPGELSTLFNDEFFLLESTPFRNQKFPKLSRKAMTVQLDDFTAERVLSVLILDNGRLEL